MADETNAIVRDKVAEIQQFMNVTGKNRQKALQYIHNYNSIDDAIANFFHHDGITEDVSVPDVFNTAINELSLIHI